MSAKTYANRSNARRAAKAAGLELDTLDFVTNDSGQWYWVAKEPEGKVVGSFADGTQLVSYSDIESAPLPRPYRLHKPTAEARAAAKAKRAAAKAPAPAPVAAATPAAAALPAGTVPAHKDFQVYGKSQILKPVEVVHNFLNANGANLSRKQALFALAELGVNYATARTQYQRWFAANRSGK